MATVLVGGQIRFNLAGTETGTVGAATRVMNMASPAGSYLSSYANGTASSQANTLASITGTAGTAGIVIDLSAITGAGIDDPLALTQIKGFLIQETTPAIGSNYMIVGDSAGTLTNAWFAPFNNSNGTERICSQGAWGKSEPLGLTVDGTHKKLQIAANTGVINYQVDIIGTK